MGSTLVAGGLAGMCNWIVAIPMDVVKSRLQAAPEGHYSGTLDVLKKLLQKEGPMALWKGAVPVLMRCVFFTFIELFYLNSTLNFGIPIVFLFQLEVYYKADRLLTGLTAQQKGITALYSIQFLFEDQITNRLLSLLTVNFTTIQPLNS